MCYQPEEVPYIWVNSGETREKFGVELIADPQKQTYAAVILAVAHVQYLVLGSAGIRT